MRLLSSATLNFKQTTEALFGASMSPAPQHPTRAAVNPSLKSHQKELTSPRALAQLQITEAKDSLKTSLAKFDRLSSDFNNRIQSTWFTRIVNVIINYTGPLNVFIKCFCLNVIPRFAQEANDQVKMKRVLNTSQSQVSSAKILLQAQSNKLDLLEASARTLVSIADAKQVAIATAQKLGSRTRCS